MKLKYEQIRMDGGTQPRSELLIEVMEDYAEQMRAGVEFPPIIVFFDGKEYWLADGFHRLGAAQRAKPDDPIEVEVIQGTQTEAQWYSFGVNKSHGLRRTREDRVRAIKAALRHPEGAQRSDNDIAEHVGVHRQTVLKYRQEMQPHLSNFDKSSRQAGEAEKDEPGGAKARQGSSPPEDSSAKPAAARPRKGRDGRTIDTAKIGRSSPNVQKPRSPTEFLEARRNGYRGRPRTMVKLELPNNHVHNCAYDLLEHFTFEYLQKVFQEVVNIHQERTQKEESE